MILFQNEDFYIETESSQIPWLKIFTQKEYKELSDMPKNLRLELFEIYDVVELQMKNYYNPTKINLASFANMLPRVHLHVMARFENDDYFPNPMWGEKLRTSKLDLPNENKFYELLKKSLQGL